MFQKDINIILAEDSAGTAALIKEMLYGLGFNHIFHAIDGLEAYEMLESMKEQGKEVHFIIADWNMPRMNGLDLLVKLKTSLDYATLPFLMMTADEDVSLASLAISSGADEFILKPISEEDLLAKMEILSTKPRT